MRYMPPPALSSAVLQPFNPLLITPLLINPLIADIYHRHRVAPSKHVRCT